MATDDSHKYHTESPTGRPEDLLEALPSGHVRRVGEASAYWTLEKSSRPMLSWHAYERWDERMPHWADSLETAYEDGVPVLELKMKALSSPAGQVPKRVHAYGERRETRDGICDERYAALLIMDTDERSGEDVVVTVLRLSESQLSQPVKAYVRRLLAVQGLTTRS